MKIWRNLFVLLVSSAMATANAAGDFASVWASVAKTPQEKSLAIGAWESFGGVQNGCNGRIYEVVRLSNNDLIAGGNFSLCGDTAANNIARWDGAQWHSLGIGAENGITGEVQAMAVIGGELYVGGPFLSHAGSIPVNRLARWDGAFWSAVGVGANNGVDGAVYAMTTIGTTLYIGGQFNSAGGVAAKSIVRWESNQFTTLGTNPTDGVANSSGLAYVRSLTIDGTQLLVGGRFTHAGGNLAANIARFDGAAWSAIGNGIGNAFNFETVYDIAMWNGEIIAVGSFNILGTQSVARWNGVTWGPLNGIGTDGVTYAVAVFNNEVYLGGAFQNVNGLSAKGLARLVNGIWQSVNNNSVGAGDGRSVDALLASPTELILAGNLVTRIGGTKANSIATYNGVTVASLGEGAGQGANAAIFCAAFSNGSLYVGGDFTQIGNVEARSVARWDGVQWHSLGVNAENGVQGTVSALASNGNTVYVGGNFNQAGSIPALSIARFENGTWSGLNNGVGTVGSTNTVRAIEIIGQNVYVGGGFSSIDNKFVGNIARWDGSTWHALGSGVSSLLNFDLISDLMEFNGELYAAGGFTNAGGVSTNRIARWNGIAWTGLGSGLNQQVYAMAKIGNELFAAGSFTSAGGNSANRIAKWNGAQWLALNSGTNSSVTALNAQDGNLYVGGSSITSAGGVPVRSVAIWNGSQWFALTRADSPLMGSINAIVGDTQRQYFVGDFSDVDSVPTSRIAVWNLDLDSVFESGFE